MREVICTTVYQFPELSDTAKEKARSWYRELGPYDDWWDAVYEDFERVCESLGIRLKTTPVRLMGGCMRAKPCIWFSGFWSQGDGACFNGEIYDFCKAFERHSPLLLEHIGKISYRSVSWKNIGRYTHSNSLDFSEELGIAETDYEGLRLLAQEQLETELNVEWERFVDAVEKEVKGFCDKLYSDLEDENEHLTSDESVLEFLDANDELEEILKEYEDEESTSP